MKPIGIIVKARKRPFLSIALAAVAGLMLVWYLLTLLVGNTYLSARVDQSWDIEGSLPKATADKEKRIILDDSLLSTVTPKLRQVLDNAREWQPGQGCNCVLLSSLEVDQINKMLGSTETGKRLIAEGWDNDDKRGELLFPHPHPTARIVWIQWRCLQLVFISPSSCISI